ncbi:hypothetical protein RRG08_014758 [Elysia crispata]|uniref:Uncharacterized protein n=1 Tax=Elysia crispata TaxID=231223 RepID=A0AAE1ASL3_9GAST|nr:hypothetical protein RRG08_014758 [Elysia crispata]
MENERVIQQTAIEHGVPADHAPLATGPFSGGLVPLELATSSAQSGQAGEKRQTQKPSNYAQLCMTIFSGTGKEVQLLRM